MAFIARKHLPLGPPIRVVQAINIVNQSSSSAQPDRRQYARGKTKVHWNASKLKRSTKGHIDGPSCKGFEVFCTVAGNRCRPNLRSVVSVCSDATRTVARPCRGSPQYKSKKRRLSRKPHRPFQRRFQRLRTRRQIIPKANKPSAYYG